MKITKGVLCVTDDILPDNWEELFLSGQVDEVYLDISTLNDDLVLVYAKALKEQIISKLSILAPVIVGPIKNKYIIKYLSKDLIRICSQNYDDYCDSIR